MRELTYHEVQMVAAGLTGAVLLLLLYVGALRARLEQTRADLRIARQNGDAARRRCQELSAELNTRLYGRRAIPHFGEAEAGPDKPATAEVHFTD